MKVLVDTSVWSLALRRKSPADSPYVNELYELIREARVQIIGPIRQELLSGISNFDQFAKLKNHLSAFDDVELTTSHFERAAEFYNICKTNGIQGSNTDFLICAIAEDYRFSILTTDKDFEHYKEILPIVLHSPRF